MIYTIVDKDNGNTVSFNARIARSFFSRVMGLMFKESIPPDYALIFYKASSIHTFFMRFPIDIVFLDKNSQVMRICQALKPWRMVMCLSSHITIELPAHKASQKSLKVGDFLDIEPSE